MISKKSIFVFLLLAIAGAVMATADEATADKSDSGNIPSGEVKYKTSFGQCPPRVAGTLTMTLLKEFEKSKSLRDVKKKLVNEGLADKHFLSTYKITYNPLAHLLTFGFDCPSPLMKTQVYKDNGQDSYQAILVDNGKLFDPTYEVILKDEKMLSYDLPSLALPIKELDSKFQNEVTDFIKEIPLDFRKKISEIIIGQDKELTMILSLSGNPTSAFFGADEWKEKSQKLRKIADYVENKGKIPTIINLRNSKKVVVKFSDKF